MIRDPLDAADAGPFQEHPKGKNRLFYRHGHFAKRFFVRLSVRLATLTATEAAQAVTMLAKTPAPNIAVRAVHGGFRLGHCFHVSIMQEALAVFKKKMRLKYREVGYFPATSRWSLWPYGLIMGGQG